MFSNQEIDMLLTALDAIKGKEGAERALDFAFTAMLSSSKEEAEQRLKDRKNEEERKRLANRQRDDEILLLKVKLIQMRPTDTTYQELYGETEA